MLAGYHNSTPERRGSLPAVLNNVGGTSQRYSANITEEILKYIPGHDNRTIYSGLESANGIHQGSLKHAKNNFESARSVALGLQAPGTAGSSTQYNIRDTTSSPEGVVSIKKLLLKRTIRAAQDSSNPSGFETPYDEEFLPIIRDADAKSELAHQVKRAINMNKVNNSSDKLASCAIIYLEDCFEALNVLDEIFQLKKSNLGEDNDHQFMRWASGGSKRITKSNDIHHDPLHIWSRYYDRLGIPPREHDEMSSHPVKQIPLSFTWEPFRFKWRTLSNDSHDVRRLMFTFEFLVPLYYM